MKENDFLTAWRTRWIILLKNTPHLKASEYVKTWIKDLPILVMWVIDPVAGSGSTLIAKGATK